MNTFETLLEIKTGRKNLLMKAIYIKDSPKKWTYYIYYYDNVTHSFYVNWLRKTINKDVLAQIINRAYKREHNQILISSFYDIINQIQMNKKPKVFYFYSSKNANFVCIDKIKLQAIRNSNLEIIDFIV